MIGALIAKSKVTSSYDLLNSRDIKSFLANWHDGSTWVYPGSISASGEFKGKKAIEDWFQFGKATHAQDYIFNTDEELRKAWSE